MIGLFSFCCSITPTGSASRCGAALAWSENDDALIAKLFDDGYRARPERVISVHGRGAWDVNCSQHITARFTHAEIAEASKM